MEHHASLQHSLSSRQSLTKVVGASDYLLANQWDFLQPREMQGATKSYFLPQWSSRVTPAT